MILDTHFSLKTSVVLHVSLLNIFYMVQMPVKIDDNTNGLSSWCQNILHPGITYQIYDHIYDKFPDGYSISQKILLVLLWLETNWFCRYPLRWRHNDHAGVSNHQPHGCLLNRLFRRKSKKTSKLRVTGLCAGNSPGTGEFPAQMASYAENVSIWWRHHASRGPFINMD